MCIRILRWKQLWQDLWEIFLGTQLPILRGLLPEEARGFTQPRELGEAGIGEVRPKGTRLCVHSSFFPSLDWASVAVSVSETQEGL